ncbi:MAG: C40 family peptidase [Pseudomonadota bacterium]
MPSENPSTSRRWEADTTAGHTPPLSTFSLAGPTQLIDKRVNACRPDIADVALAGRLFAPHYAAPLIRSATATAFMRQAPSNAAEAVSQLLPGEGFAALEIASGWAWGYSLHDHYVGYVLADLLGPPTEPTHRVSVREALVFADASIKSPVTASLPLSACIQGTVDGSFLRTEQGFIHLRHLAPVGDCVPDPVEVAELCLGMPYLWGGRGGGGIDCSGLVQIALAAAGHAAPRDTDMQRDTIGSSLPEDAPLMRGDVISFPGHVGLMVDDSRLIHANAHWMGVVIEPLADVVARLKPNHDRPILSRRRLAS